MRHRSKCEYAHFDYFPFRLCTALAPHSAPELLFDKLSILYTKQSRALALLLCCDNVKLSVELITFYATGARMFFFFAPVVIINLSCAISKIIIDASKGKLRLKQD